MTRVRVMIVVITGSLFCRVMGDVEKINKRGFARSLSLVMVNQNIVDTV